MSDANSPGAPDPNVTVLLERYLNGDEAAAGELLPLLYEELHRLAEIQMRKERRVDTLSPTVLVHEAYLRLVESPPDQLMGRAHFCSVAARAMRRVLIDHVRKKLAAKRGGGGIPVTLEEGVLPNLSRSEDLLRLDEALRTLEELDPELLDIVELRFFAGLTQEEVSELRGMSIRTVKRRWATARAWLARELQ